MIYRNGYVLDPGDFLNPVYTISPYANYSSIKVDGSIPKGDIIEYYNEQFPLYTYNLYSNARSSILSILDDIGIKENENIAIFTTSGNKYISGCVTKSIDKVALWQRTIDDKTRAIFVIHEFGFPFEDMEKLQRFGIPIIEDCAHSFISNNLNKNVGKYADYIIFSYPKIFPIQVGGVCLSRRTMKSKIIMDTSLSFYINKTVNSFIKEIPTIKKKRQENYRYLADKIGSMGMSPRFIIHDNICPGVFMFNTLPTMDLDRMKLRFQANGIESSIFYGEKAFFIPVHQYLSTNDLDYFLELIQSCLEGEYGNF